MNTDERWYRVRDLFERAHDEQPRDISEWLDRQGVDDWQVREEVRSLLRHHSSAGSFLLNPAGDQLAALIGPERRFEPGQVIGSYTVIRQLGRGGMGEVYLAKDGTLGRMVALKAVSPELASDPVYRDRLKREASIAGKLQHPGICVVHDFKDIDGEFFIVNEYIEGHNLREEIGGPRPSAEDVMQTARELSQALAHAHKQRVTHRDLKPENVMRTQEGHLKILDFGLARIESEGNVMHSFTQPGTVIGTPAYMAPEQFNGLRADARSDVWALGVMLYEYACGVHPFHAESRNALVARISHGDFEPLENRRPDLGSSVASAIERSLEKSPADRLASGAEFLAHLARSESRDEPNKWWRIHQLVVLALYFVACALAWQVKEWQPGIPTPLFLAAGVVSTIAGMLRGHLLFVAQTTPRRLHAEHSRLAQSLLGTDLLLGTIMAGDGILLAFTRPLPGVLTIALGVGIALARLVVEPARMAASLRR